MSTWPDALKLQTRKFLDGMDPFPCGDVLHMKSLDTFFAYITKEDLDNGKIILYDKKTKVQTQFNSAGELFAAGWIVDIKNPGKLRLLTLEETRPDKRVRCAKVKKIVPWQR